MQKMSLVAAYSDSDSENDIDPDEIHKEKDTVTEENFPTELAVQQLQQKYAAELRE